MKNVLLAFSILVLSTSALHADDSIALKRVFVVEWVNYPRLGSKRHLARVIEDEAECRRKCKRAGGEASVEPYVIGGWRFLSSSHKAIVVEEFRDEYVIRNGVDVSRNPPYVPLDRYGCECVGTEYVLEKNVQPTAR